MKKISNLTALAATLALLVGCTNNPYTGEREAGKAGIYGGIGAVSGQNRHLHGLAMVQDHALHEGDVVCRIAVVGDPGGLAAFQRAARLTGSAGLDEGSFLGEGAAGEQEGTEGSGAPEQLADRRTGFLQRLYSPGQWSRMASTGFSGAKARGLCRKRKGRDLRRALCKVFR